jgi:hypothetical protein
MARIAQIRTAIGELQPSKITEIDGEPRAEIKDVVSPIRFEKGTTKSGWFKAGIALLTIALLGIAYVIIMPFMFIDPEAYIATLFGMTIMFTTPFLIPGAYCLRRGLIQHKLLRHREKGISNLWWLLPIFLSFVGGIISWVKQKDTDELKAANMLTSGIVTTLVWAFLFAFIQAPT